MSKKQPVSGAEILIALGSMVLSHAHFDAALMRFIIQVFNEPEEKIKNNILPRYPSTYRLLRLAKEKIETDYEDKKYIVKNFESIYLMGDDNNNKRNDIIHSSSYFDYDDTSGELALLQHDIKKVGNPHKYLSHSEIADVKDTFFTLTGKVNSLIPFIIQNNVLEGETIINPPEYGP